MHHSVELFNKWQTKNVMELKSSIPIDKMDQDMEKKKVINEDNTAQVINGGAI